MIVSIVDGKGYKIHLSRQEHDSLLDNDSGLLKYMFKTFNRQWHLSGVTFFNVPSYICTRLYDGAGTANV